MKVYLPLLCLTVLLSGCSKDDQTLVDGSQEDTAPALNPRRVYPDTEYCVIKHSLEGTAAAIGTIPGEALRTADKHSFTNSTDGAQYGIHLAFLGSKDMKDFYSVQLEVKGELRPPMETVYLGHELELFRDQDYVILMRPERDPAPDGPGQAM